jgi:hypothetical protein
MRSFNALFDRLRRTQALVSFMLKLCLNERIFSAFFVLSLIFISVINIIYSEVFQKALASQMAELQYAFTTWHELASHMGVSAASIFMILIISVSFLPVLQYALKKDVMSLVMSKPVRLSAYIIAMFWAFVNALFILVSGWWLFVTVTVTLHGGKVAVDLLHAFACVFAFGCLSLSVFIMFFSIFRSALASVFTLLFSASSVIMSDAKLLADIKASLTGMWAAMFPAAEWFFSSFGDWISLAFQPALGIDRAGLLLRTVVIVAVCLCAATWNLRRQIKAERF